MKGPRKAQEADAERGPKVSVLGRAWRTSAPWLVRLPQWIAGFVLFVLMFMTFADVILRSTINNPIEAATELTRIFMAVVVFVSLPLVAARNGQIAVDLLDSYFSPVASRWRDGVINIVCGVLLCWPAERIFVLAERAREFGDTTEYLHIPQFYLTHFVFVMTTLTALVMIACGSLAILRPDLMRVSKQG